MSQCMSPVTRNGPTQQLARPPIPGSQPIQASTLLPTAMSPNTCPLLMQAQACRTRLRRPALLSLPTTQPATMANTTCRGPLKDRLSKCHRLLHQLIPPLIILSSGIRCLQMADRSPTQYPTIKIFQDMRLLRSLTLGLQSQMRWQRDPRYSLVCLRSVPICQLMVATGRFLNQ